MAGNKVKFNIKKAHYAKKSEETTGFEKPVHVPGSVSLTLEQQGELTPFYADGIKYYIASSNGGYQGDWAVALLPDSFRTDILGEMLDKNKVLIEDANPTTKTFAFGFEIDGDVRSYRFWFTNCTATKPSIEANTTEDTKEPQTDTITISASSDEDRIVRMRTTDETPENVFNGWFDEVYAKDKEVATMAKAARKA